MFPYNLYANMNIYVFVTVTVLLSLRISTNVWCAVRVFCCMYILLRAAQCYFYLPSDTLAPSPSPSVHRLTLTSLISRGLTDNHSSSFTSSLTDQSVIPSFYSVSVLSLAELFIGIVRRLSWITKTYQPMSRGQ